MSYRKLTPHPLNSLLRSVLTRTAAGALGAAAPLAVLANPTGGQVVGGSATIGSAGANGVVINQSSQKAIINWQQFSVGNGQYVQFVQPNSSSVVLNRVTGSNASSIFGDIIANGQVFLVNPNGVYFAPGASIDVQGLVASTLDLSDADFMQGRYVFHKQPGTSDAGVVNDGSILTTRGGYVVLAGDYARNGGAIVAQTGRVYLAAGGAATLTLDDDQLISYAVDGRTLSRLAGVSNTGVIAANGGLVMMTADVANTLTATAVNNSGLITAHSVSEEGGEIVLEAKGGGIENSGTLDATADVAGAAGGTVILHGDGHTQLTDTSVIDAAGDGAKGGFIEVSGHALNLRGRVHTGKGGTLLLDPFFLHIVNGSSNTTAGSTNNVGVGWINQHLQSGNVLLQASNSIMNVGHAARTIHPTSGAGNLSLQVNDGTIDIRGLTINIKGSLDIHAAAGSGGSIQMDGAIAKTITLHASTIAVHGALSATSGGISITGRTSRGNHNPAFSISGAMHATGRVLVSYSNEGGVPTGFLKTQDVTAGTIKIVGEKINTGNLTATQSVTNAIEVKASGSSVGTIHHNPASILVAGNVIASHGGIFMAVHGGSDISVQGKVKAAFSHATLSASNASGVAHVKVTNTVSGPEVNIIAKSHDSASISVGGVTATEFDANIKASDSLTSAAQIARVTTGALKAAKNVNVTAVGGATGVEKITVNGAITAYTSTCGLIDCNNGNVNLTAANGSVDVTGNILVTHSAFDPGQVVIQGRTISVTGNITAGSVSLDATGATDNGGSLHVAGNISASVGSVTLKDIGGKGINMTGSISAAKNVTLSASSAGGFHTTLKAGNISAGGMAKILYHGGGAAGTGITVQVGNVDSQHSMSIDVTDTSNAGALKVHTGNLTNHGGSHSNGQGIKVTLSGPNPSFQAANITNLALSGQSCTGCSAGNIRVTLDTTNGSAGDLKVLGSVKSSHGYGDLIASNATINVGAMSAFSIELIGRDIAFGNLTATNGLQVTASDNRHSIGTVVIAATPGTTIKARSISIDMHASYGGRISIANLDASSGHGKADISIIANSPQGANTIVVNGGITVNGVGSNNGFSSGMPAGGAPVAAELNIQAEGSTGAAHTVKVTGNINVTGHAGNFSIATHELPSCGECGTYTLTGKGGAGVVQVTAQGSHGSVQLLGANTVKGTEALLQAGATVIKTGAITVAGSGDSFAVTAQSGSHGSHHFTSHNTFGRAMVSLGSDGGGAATITTGNISVSGKGSATVQMTGTAITAGNITVTATKAKTVRSYTGSSTHSVDANHFGLPVSALSMFGLQMQNGSFSGGVARVMLAAGQGSPHSLPPPAQSVKVGNVSVTGVGQAAIEIVANNVQTGSLAANAAAGKMVGSFSSAGEAGHFHQKMKLNDGQAVVEVQTGTGTGTVINIAGGVTATGPIAQVNLFGQTIKVTKGITVVGKGGQATVSGSGTGGSGFHSNVKAPGPMTGITLGGVGTVNAGSINVGGVVSAKGLGLIGIAITGAKVALGGLSASASNTENYSLVSTRDGINDTFAAGSVAVLVFDEAGGVITGPAQINGDVNITALHGNVALGAELNATGKVTVTGKNIDTNVGNIIKHITELGSVTAANHSGSGGPQIPSSAALAPKLAATAVNLTATAGSINLTGAAITGAADVVTLKATQDIILSGVTINVNTLSANAGSTIHNGGAIGTITANALALTAGKNINLSSTQITVGKGSVASLASDPLLLQALAAAGLSPSTPKPNAYFNAGGTLTLGKLTLTGNYMYLQGANITILGPVSTPADSVIQLAPTTGPASIGVEQNPGTGSVLNLSNSLLLSLFPGTTLVLGNGSESGAVTLGSAGTVNIGSSNLIVDTTGTVTGLDNIISTGLVSTVESLLASALAPPTPSEIDPNSSNNNNEAGKHHQQGDDDPDAGTTGGGTISQSTDTGGACH